MQSRAVSLATAFAFGVCVGGFGAVTVIREAVPLRDHVYAIGLSLLFGFPILSFLFVWYLKTMNNCKRVFGEKGGKIVGSLLAFLVVSVALFFVVVLGIFYAAVV